MSYTKEQIRWIVKDFIAKAQMEAIITCRAFDDPERIAEKLYEASLGKADMLIHVLEEYYLNKPSTDDYIKSPVNQGARTNQEMGSEPRNVQESPGNPNQPRPEQAPTKSQATRSSYPNPGEQSRDSKNKETKPNESSQAYPGQFPLKGTLEPNRKTKVGFQAPPAIIPPNPNHYI